MVGRIHSLSQGFMRSVFVDSSGFFALLRPEDPFHAEATDCFARADDEEWTLVTTNYVVHESWALIQVRLGWDAVEAWRREIVPFCTIFWVDKTLHALGEARWTHAGERRLSLTDCVSLEFMRLRGLNEAIVQDEHFTRAGIRLPAP